MIKLNTKQYLNNAIHDIELLCLLPFVKMKKLPKLFCLNVVTLLFKFLLNIGPSLLVVTFHFVCLNNNNFLITFFNNNNHRRPNSLLQY